MKEMKKLTLALLPILVLVLSLGLLATSCGEKPVEEGEKPTEEVVETDIVETLEPYVIGGVFSVTGKASPLGDPEKKSMEMFADMINEKGGIDGHLVEVVIYDDEGDVDKALTMTKKLIENDNVLAIVGPSRTPTTLAIIELVQEEGVPLISCAAGIEITDPVKEWVFKTPQTDYLAVKSIYEYLNELGIKKVAIFTVSNAFGESGKVQLKKLAPDFGIEIVAEESFSDDDNDMTTQLTNIKGTDAEAIICWGTNPAPALIAKNMVQLGMDIPLIQSHGVASPKYIELGEDAVNGNVLPTGKILVLDQLSEDDPQFDVLNEYKTLYEDTYDAPISGFGGYSWDAMGILTEALKKSGGDRAKLRDAIEETVNFIGVSGIYNITPEDHNGLTKDAFVMVIIEDGKWKIIE